MIKSIKRLTGNSLIMGLVLLILSSLLTIFIVNSIPLIKIAENHLADVRLSLLAFPRPQSEDIAVILINEETLATLPYRSPLDRLMIANLLRQLEAHSVAAIGLNVIFDRPTEVEKDNLLYKVMRDIKVPVIVPSIFNMVGFSPVQSQYSRNYLKGVRTGISQIFRDPLDFTVRQFLLRHIRGRTVYLGFAGAIANALGTELPGNERLRIDFRASPDSQTPPFPIYAAHEVVNLPVNALRNRVVLIGSDLGLSSRHRTPLSVQADYMPGVLIEAHVLSQLFDGSSLSVIEADGKLMFIVAAALLGILISLAHLRWILKIIISFSVFPIAWITAFVIYINKGLAVPMVTPTIAFIIAAVAGFIWEWQNEFSKRKQVQQAFGHFLAPTVVEQMLLDPESLELGGEIREVSFLFTDLEGFTALTENYPPQVMVRLVNAYLEESCEIVMRHGGTIDKIVGDALHVMFNAPVHQDDHPQRAVECALELNEWSNEFRARQAALDITLGVTRIGINTGSCMVGNFGGSLRFDYTAHGDAINTAARLESINQRLGTTICVSESTARRCNGIRFLPVATLLLYGKTLGINTFLPYSSSDEKLRDSFGQEYEYAYSLLKEEKMEAKELFENLMTKYPGHPLVILHAARIASGEMGTTMTMRNK